MPMFTDAIKKRLDAVRILRRQIAEHPDFCVEDVERKGLMLKNAEEQTKRLVYAANHLLAASWDGGSEDDLEDRLKKALTHVEYNFKDLPVEQLETEGKQRIDEVGCPKPFHWPLEFPEVFALRDGFDGIVGNPPFMGGQKITGNIGRTLSGVFGNATGQGEERQCGFVCVFLLRANSLLRQGGQFGLLATNTIAQGDTREVGLDQLIGSGCTIPRAVQSRPWPGAASLEVAHVWVRHGSWQGGYILEERAVAGITGFLTPPGTVTGKPYRLKANEGKSYQGSIVLGMGFVLEPEEACRLELRRATRIRDVLFPVPQWRELGNAVLDNPRAGRFINFFDWPLEQAIQYSRVLPNNREQG